jgi:hypothetical protein
MTGLEFIFEFYDDSSMPPDHGLSTWPGSPTDPQCHRAGWLHDEPGRRDQP